MDEPKEKPKPNTRIGRSMDRDRRMGKPSFLTRIHAARNGQELDRVVKEVDAAKGISSKTFKKLHVAAEVKAKALLAQVEQHKETVVAASKGDNVT